MLRRFLPTTSVPAVARSRMLSVSRLGWEDRHTSWPMVAFLHVSLSNPSWMYTSVRTSEFEARGEWQIIGVTV